MGPCAVIPALPVATRVPPPHSARMSLQPQHALVEDGPALMSVTACGISRRRSEPSASVTEPVARGASSEPPTVTSGRAAPPSAPCSGTETARADRGRPRLVPPGAAPQVGMSLRDHLAAARAGGHGSSTTDEAVRVGLERAQLDATPSTTSVVGGASSDPRSSCAAGAPLDRETGRAYRSPAPTRRAAAWASASASTSLMSTCARTTPLDGGRPAGAGRTAARGLARQGQGTAGHVRLDVRHGDAVALGSTQAEGSGEERSLVRAAHRDVAGVDRARDPRRHARAGQGDVGGERAADAPRAWAIPGSRGRPPAIRASMGSSGRTLEPRPHAARALRLRASACARPSRQPAVNGRVAAAARCCRSPHSADDDARATIALRGSRQGTRTRPSRP